MVLFFDKVNCLGRLTKIVLRDVTYENVGIQTDRWRAARRLIAAFVALIDTAVAGRRIIPLSDRTSSVAAFNANSPEASSTNSTRSPASKPSFRRTASGMVICPLLVSVAVVIKPLTYAKPLQWCKDILRSRKAN